MLETLETERLILRKLTKNDAEAMYFGWCNDPEVTKYVTWEVHKDISETKALLDLWMKEYEDPKTVRFGIVLKSENKLIGAIDVVEIVDGVPEIGYTLSRAYWRQGYMSEACKKVVDYLFSIGYKKITIRAEFENVASNRVIIKCGFKFVDIVHIHEPREAVVNVYELEKK